MKGWLAKGGLCLLIFASAFVARGEQPLSPEDQEIVEHMDFLSHMEMLKLEPEMSALAKLLDTIDGKTPDKGTEPVSGDAPVEPEEPKK